MKHPQIAVRLSDDDPTFVAHAPLVDPIPLWSVSIRQEAGTLQVMGTKEQLLGLAEGIRDAIHLVEIEQLGHDIAVAP